MENSCVFMHGNPDPRWSNNSAPAHSQVRGHLLVGWDSIRSWEQLRPGSMRIPVPHLVVEALFSYAVAMGYRLQGDEGRRTVSLRQARRIGEPVVAHVL